MNVYIAGSYAGRHRIRSMAARLSPTYNVLSRWFYDEDFVEQAWDKDMGGRVAEAMAHRDMVGVMQCDIFIIDTFEPSTTGGRCTEMGMAIMRKLLGHDLLIVQIGPRTNIFETLVHEKYDSWNEFCEQWGIEYDLRG
jgi:hypothetical protein